MGPYQASLVGVGLLYGAVTVYIAYISVEDWLMWRSRPDEAHRLARQFFLSWAWPIFAVRGIFRGIVALVPLMLSRIRALWADYRGAL